MLLRGRDEEVFVNDLFRPRDRRVPKKKKKNVRKRKTGNLKLENKAPTILKLENESIVIPVLPLFAKYQSTRVTVNSPVNLNCFSPAENSVKSLKFKRCLKGVQLIFLYLNSVMQNHVTF